MGKDTDELFSELTKAKTDKELKTFYERNEEELQHPDAVACLEQLFAKHKLKRAMLFSTLAWNVPLPTICWQGAKPLPATNC